MLLVPLGVIEPTRLLNGVFRLERFEYLPLMMLATFESF
jgi:hypothetical protein